MAELSEDNTVEWQAAQWVARRMGDEPFDKDDFDRWVAGDPQRGPLFDTMWGRIAAPQVDEALTAIVRRRRSRRAALAGGLAVMVAAVGGYQAWPMLELSLTVPRTYVAADHAIREVVLEDGTRLTLAGGAEVRVRYVGRRRDVELTRGTLFANVARNPDRPFHITAGDGAITVLGTRFEVASKPEMLRVTVEEGHVRFGRDRWFATPIELTANQAAILSARNLQRTVDVSPRRGVARWRSEWADYRDAPLQQVLDDLESVSPLPIRIASAKLAGLKVSGRIRLTDPDRQIENLSIIHHFTVRRRDGEILISAAGAAPSENM
ncbi:hypothetical protein HL653_17565 [Sphingomonas sp. AP4-R1]|uniref:FecR family protein n=1 Tax=Sphingomonas sp. AP4-R1 TaxID=2735134 RepID=UPI00149382FD|nr:FecR domain-containing protein [Sphingomonas sp. AP4-R1]QJU59326.1 hypothetical protein HL653_17565 [Sphingomonas sp. AP4-R1]